MRSRSSNKDQTNWNEQQVINNLIFSNFSCFRGNEKL